MADYQVTVSYGSDKLIPAPFVRLEKNFERFPDGSKKQTGWRITASGKVSAWRGSPKNDGSWHSGSGYPAEPDATDGLPENRVENLRNKLGAIAQKFSQDGLWFEIQPPDGPPIKFAPRIQSVDFADGKWFDVVDYAIQMEADEVFFGSFSDAAVDPGVEESWQVEPLDDFRQTFRLTHTAAAQGRAVYDGNGAVSTAGWERAETLVEDALGYSGSFAASLGGSGTPYNHTVNRQADVANGRYSATEAWTLSATAYTEDQTTEVAYSAETGFKSVRVSGTVTGLQAGSDPAARLTNAEARVAVVTAGATILATAQAAAGDSTLNPAPLSTSLTKNRPQGVVSYAWEFNTRPAVTAGRLSEQVTVTIDDAVPVVAQLGVVGRVYGPVLQDVGSYTQRSCTVNFDVVVSGVGYGLPEPTIPVVSPLTTFVAAVGGLPATVYVASDRAQWNPTRGSYNRSTTYIYQLI